MNSKIINNFDKGLITRIEAQSLPDGAASESLNFLTKGDKIELRRGTLLLGDENTDAGGKIIGLYVATMSNGTDIAFRARGSKLEYLDTATDTWTEIGTNVLGTVPDGERITFAEYHSLAGDQMFVSSPSTVLLKIMLANPGSYADMYDSTKNFKGNMIIKTNRMFMWNLLNDRSGLYGSYVDDSQYTPVASENIGTGDGGTKTFADTLAFKAGGAKRTCFGISVTDGVETFRDNYDGTLVGSAGGTGTINYMTGAISVTFAGAPAGAAPILCDYQWEDSTNKGVCDFTKSATRLAGEGFIFRQDDGGGTFKNIMSLRDVEYCFHRLKTWALSLTADDTNATNLIYRDKVGIPNIGAAVSTGEGIYYVDDMDSNDPHFRLLTFDINSSEVIPVSRSVNIDLSGYYFDQAEAKEFGDLVVIGCRTIDSPENNRAFVYNRIWKSWDVIEAYFNCLAVYDGALISGDSLSNNVYILFSGFDDDDSRIEASWTGKLDNLGSEELKKVKRLVISGEIAKDQSFDIYIDADNSGFTKIDTISGNGGYVDMGQAINVGANTIGSKSIGGGGEAVFAYFYEKEIHFNSDKFYAHKIRFVPMGLGYISISKIVEKDIRLKGNRIPYKYR